MRSSQFFVRNIQYKFFIEEFIISSLLAILGIRAFLKIANYPQLGLQGLHISHMLWGGLLMCVALILLLSILNNDIKRIAAVIGGLGFGTFIDELGKFITSDNNYFYQPTFALIYIFFILLYISMQFIERHHEFTEKEYLVNSIELIKDAVINDLDKNEQKLAISYLSKAHTDHEITKTLHELYSKIEVIEPSKPNVIIQFRNRVKDIYFSLVKKPWFKNAVIVFFLIQGVVSILTAILTLLEKNAPLLPSFLLPHAFTSKSYNLVHIYSTLLSVLFIFLGISRIYKSRLGAYNMFKKSILISILLTQVFAFYYNPTRAIGTLIFNIIIWYTLTYMIENEEQLHPKNK